MKREERTLPASDELFDEAADQISVRNLPVFKTGFVLMRNARAWLDCTLTIIEPTVDYASTRSASFEISHFDRAIKSSVPC